MYNIENICNSKNSEIIFLNLNNQLKYLYNNFEFKDMYYLFDENNLSNSIFYYFKKIN